MNNLKRVGVIVGARMSSKRFPGKVLKPLMKIPMLAFLLRRLNGLVLADEIILATSNQVEDDVLTEVAKNESVKVYRGNLNDVTERYVLAAEANDIDTVVRVTGDCPFVNAELVDYCLNYIKDENFDLATTKGLFPIGLDAEIYHNSALSQLNKSDKLTSIHREHVTLFFYENSEHYNILQIKPPNQWSNNARTYTVDTQKDYERMSRLVKKFNDEFVSIEDIINI
jgi:spore coat polysaccharide biosynthesis protein SpsF